LKIKIKYLTTSDPPLHCLDLRVVAEYGLALAWLAAGFMLKTVLLISI